MARQGLGLAGGVIGGYFGGPVGAQIGFALGSAIGGMIDPQQIQGPKLGEAPVQTGRDGVPIPVGWGIIHTAGNIIQKNPITEREEKDKQGKGGGVTVVNIRRDRTFAIGLARSIEGPIAGILRIWENDKLVYDMRETPAIPIADTVEYAKNFTLYYGDEAQLPDPELEAHWGVGTTPAFRGLPYAVWDNYDITDFGSAIPQYRFELQTGADLTLTSKPYPIEDFGAIIGSVLAVGGQSSIYDAGAVAGSVLPLGGGLAAALKSYEDWPPEGIDGSVVPLGGTIDQVLKTFDVEPGGIDGSVTPLDGEFAQGLILYSHYPIEGIDGTVTPLGGTLT
jgi:hypothetical protein